VVVDVGLTGVEPFGGWFPATPLIETDVALLVTQLSVEDCPEVIDGGLATNDVTTGDAGAMVTVWVVDPGPPAFVAMSLTL
jgi:hypothetical protein